MTFQPTNPRVGERGERAEQLPDAVNPYMTTNPTLVLHTLGGTTGVDVDPDDWATNAAMPNVTPDVLELLNGGKPLQTATEDLWALSSMSSAGRGSWQRSVPAGQSDFLIVEPTLAPPEPQSLANVSQNRSQSASLHQHNAATIAGSLGNNWALRTSPTYNDPLRPLSVTISTAIERHFLEQNEPMPTERTAENAELVRRLTVNYLRHDPTLSEIIADATDADRLLAMIVDEVLGFGPLDPLMRDETVGEILVTGPHMTYVEQGGRLNEVPIHFADDAHLLRIIQKILRPLGLSVNANTPIADGRMADGTRVNVVIPPSAAAGSVITIRRAVRRAFSLEQLVRNDALSLHMADFLRLCVNARLNIVISGTAGAGKTTFLNAIASSIHEQERIVTIEDTAELQLHQRHVVPLHAHAATPEGDKAVTAADLLLNALRMRPQRIILGDCRNREALNIIQAMNIGYDGSMTTVYANSARDALARLESLAMTGGSAILPHAMRQQIATGVDLVVHCARLRDGTRRITHVADVIGMEGDAIAMQDLFVFREAGLDMSTGRIRGEFAATGARPSFVSRIEDGQSQMFPSHYFPRGA